MRFKSFDAYKTACMHGLEVDKPWRTGDVLRALAVIHDLDEQLRFIGVQRDKANRRADKAAAELRKGAA